MPLRVYTRINLHSRNEYCFMNKTGVILNKLIWICTLAFFVLLNVIFAIVGRSGSRLGGIVLMLPIGFLFVLLILKRANSIRLHVSGYHFYMLLLSLFCYASSLWASNKSPALNRGEEMFELFIVMSIIYSCFQEKTSVSDLLKVIMFGGFFIVVFYTMIYGWGYVITSIRNSSRVTSDLINANSLGMTAAYSIIVYFNFLVNRQTKLWWLPFVALSLVVLLASQSRKAILIIVLGCFGTFILNNLDNRKIISNTFKVLFIIVFAVVLLIILSRFNIMSGIMDRMKGLINGVLGKGSIDNSTLIRIRLKEIGQELFSSHPVLGVGIDCARYYTVGDFGSPYYLHDNYIEMLADGGIIGFIVYYWLYFVMLLRMVKYHNFKDPEYVICFVILILRLIMDYGSVSFVDKDTYLYVLLLWIECERIKGKKDQMCIL